MGLRLVKKSVNQDDVGAYHLFYADGAANPGTDLTYVDWSVAREQRGTRPSRARACVGNGEAALGYWRDRLSSSGISGDVREIDGRLTLAFEDPEGQRLDLIDDGGAGPATPWEKSLVPRDSQIRGLGSDLADGVASRPYHADFDGADGHVAGA